MTVVPILSRELTRAVRSPLLYWLRTGSVVAGVICGIALLSGTHLWTSSGAIGRDIFIKITWPAFALCLLSGVVLSSNLLCEERREGSLALLFLTRLKGLDVVLGKLSAILFLAMQIVLGILPLLAVSMALGGISLEEFARAVQVLLTMLLFSLAAGLFVSALNKFMARAMMITCASIVGWSSILFAADWLLRSLLMPEPIGMIIPGPIQSMAAVLDSSFKLPPQSFQSALWFQLLLSLVLIALASSMLKRLSIADEPGAAVRIRSDTKAQWRVRRPFLRHNPIHWLTLRHRWRWLSTWLIFSTLIVAWLASLVIFDFSRGVQLLGLFGVAPLLHILLKIAIAAEAAERFRGAARNSELELLLVTPLSVAKVLQGQYKGMLRQFLWPVVTLLLVDLFLAFFYDPTAGSALFASLLIYTLGITLLVDLPALIWRGLWNGLLSRNGVTALRRTLLEVLALPLPIFVGTIALSPVLYVYGLISGSDSGGWLIGTIVWWWVVTFICNTLLQRNAKIQLQTWFRSIVADPLYAERQFRRKSAKPNSTHLRYAPESAHPLKI